MRQDRPPYAIYLRARRVRVKVASLVKADILQAPPPPLGFCSPPWGPLTLTKGSLGLRSWRKESRVYPFCELELQPSVMTKFDTICTTLDDCYPSRVRPEYPESDLKPGNATLTGKKACQKYPD